MVTMRIRSCRPAMPSISGPRSTVASNSTLTPFVSGAAFSSLIGAPRYCYKSRAHRSQPESLSTRRSHLQLLQSCARCFVSGVDGVGHRRTMAAAQNRQRVELLDGVPIEVVETSLLLAAIPRRLSG